MNTPSPFGAPYPLQDIDIRKSVGRSTIIGDTAYIAGDFNYLGPNTGAGVVMTSDGVNILISKKWRVNGPVLASAADGAGGFYIAGAFSRVGDSIRYNVAHINSLGIPNNWKPAVNDVARALVLKGDTVVIGGAFTSVNGSTRNAYAMLNANVDTLLPWTLTNNALKPGTVINAFRLVDSMLYVVGKYNTYNTVGALFKVNLNNNYTYNFPDYFQQEESFTVDVSDNKRILYVGGRAGGGGSATHNGFAIDINTNGLRYNIDVDVQSVSGRGAIYSLKAYGKNVYAGGLFNFGIVGGNSFTQKGLVVFDTATAQPRNYLKDCDGIVSYLNAFNGKVYIGGEFAVIGGFPHINFAIYDTAIGNANSSTISVSDQCRTISFSGNTMYMGGYFQSLGGVARKNFAAYDYVTGQIKSWTPNFYANSVYKMEARGDTILMAGNFGQIGNPFSLGAFLAVNGVTGNIYTNATYVPGTGFDILIDSGYLYLSGTQGLLVKLTLPGLASVSTWRPNPGFDIRALQKKGGKLYGVGDTYYSNIFKGYICEIDNASGKTLRTTVLNPPPNAVGDFGWISSGILVGDKMFFSGVFSQLLQVPRTDFGVFNVATWSLDSIDLNVDGSSESEAFKFINGKLYFYGDFRALNNQRHKFFAQIDTTVGAVFPDQLHLNNDDPFGYSLNDDYFYLRLNTVQFIGNSVILGGNFRNINQAMFPSLAKIQLRLGGSMPTTPQGISGASTIPCPSQNNLYTIINANSNSRYAWFYSGQNTRIENNGTDSVRLDIGPLGSPGVLKAIAMTECGKSDTVFFNINLSTSEPTVNAKNLIVVRKTDTTATVKFTPGNGARRIVIIKASSGISNLSQDGQEYIANNSFGLGSNLGSNTYVLYKGTGDSVNITSLSPATIYCVSVIEFNGSGGGTNYLTTNNPVVVFTTYASEPRVQASSIVFTNKTTNSITINCTAGNGQHRLVVIKQGITAPNSPVDANGYSANTVFGTGSNLGSSSYVISNTTTPVTLTGLTVFTTYTVSVFEFNGSDTNSNYLLTAPPVATFTTRAVEPTVPASNIIFSNISGTTADISCTPGNGSSRLVVIRKDSAVVDAPVDFTNYNWNTGYGIGSSIGHASYVIRTFTPTNVYNLSPNHTYYVKIFEFNGFDTLSDFLTVNAPMDSFTTPTATPTNQASYLYAFNLAQTTASLSCNGGNGSGTLFVVRKNSPVIDNPIDAVDYDANPAFGSGSNIGNNTFVVGKVIPTNMSNLEPGATYYAKAFAFNGTGTQTRYLIANAPSTSFTTLVSTGQPTVQASNMSISNVTATSATINCTYGNGSNRLIVIKTGTSVASTPTDATTYNANTIFGSGSDIGNQTYVISNTAAPVTVTGLTPNVDYTISIFEFNGTGASTDYLTTSNPQLSFHTLFAEPSVQASNILISNVTMTSATINCTPGNGQNRLVIIKAGTSLSGQPTDGSVYTASTAFGTGSDIGSQTFVISNTTLPLTVTGLAPNSDYTIRIFEYNGSGTATNYLTSNSPPTSFHTQSSEPTVQSSNIIVTNIGPAAATINCTAGNGTNRLIVIKAGNSISAEPVDGTMYNANTIFGGGSDIGAQTYVISTTSAPVTVTNLSPEAEYTIAIFEFNGTASGVNYLTTSTSKVTFKTLAIEPTTQVGSLVITSITTNSAIINCSAGNGSGRIIALKAGTTSTAIPTDGTTYPANSTFSNGGDLGAQTFVISTIGGPVTVVGLSPNSDYTATAFEFNGNSSTTNYLTANFPLTSFKTPVATGIVDLGLPGVSLKISPNPFSENRLNFNFKTNKPGKFLVEVYQMNGARLLSKEWMMLIGSNDRILNLPLSLSSSTVIVHCNFDGRNGSLLMIKK